MGGGVILRQFSVIQSISPVGVFTFDTLLTNNGAGSGGNTIASLLLGYPSTVVRALNPFEPKYHTNEPSLYVQDDWRTTSWLTFNLGLRYDVFTPFTEEGNHLANFDPATQKVLVAGLLSVFALLILPITALIIGGFAYGWNPVGTPVGAASTHQPAKSNPGKVSATAGTSGSSGIRFGDVTASARSLPDAICPLAAG